MASNPQPLDVDPLDYRGALARFREEVIRLARWWRPGIENESYEVLCVEASAHRAAEAGYVVGEHAPQDFPTQPFAVLLLANVQRLQRAAFNIRVGEENPEAFLEEEVQLERDRLREAWRAVRIEYCKMQSTLYEAAVRAGVAQTVQEWQLSPLPGELSKTTNTEAATGQTCADETEALKGLSESERRVAEEMRMALDFLRQQSETEEHEFERPTYEVMYRALEELLADKGEKPSQTAETWRRYASKVRRHLDMPGRKRRA
jgi:hypothetical protein